MADELSKAIKAWHGSPSNHDKFEDRGLGTGHGAHALGYGHYFASSKAGGMDHVRMLRNLDENRGRGFLYKVNLHVDPNRMLKFSATEDGSTVSGYDMGKLTTEEIAMLKTAMGEHYDPKLRVSDQILKLEQLVGKEAAKQRMIDAGIHGVDGIDQYVVFDPERIEIVEKANHSIGAKS